MILLESLSSIISLFSKRTKIYGINRSEICKENLKVVLKRNPTKDEINEVFKNHVLYHLYLFLYPLIRNKIKINPESNDRLQELIIESMEKGAICVSAHIGIPEFGAKIFVQNGIKVFALVEDLKSKYQKLFFNITRRNIGIITEPRFKKFVSYMLNPAGKIFVVLVDRPVPNSKPAEMFGEIFYISDLPIRLSKRFGLSIFGIACVRDNKNFILKIKKIHRDDEMTKFIEDSIMKSYTQWNLFFKRKPEHTNSQIQKTSLQSC
ncbi:MAG: hypothetical protein NZ927_00675 [Candidatus Calescibacterium sp.]|nr:hypothetical protein [Candidatus Calescibacterium sp.]MCX7733881.1 hypothetical protein [bacterium]MDW8086662.1 hypothetical protein [Candidatus Calescibacterium sp.]